MIEKSATLRSAGWSSGLLDLNHTSVPILTLGTRAVTNSLPREGLPPFDPLEGTPLELPVFIDKATGGLAGVQPAEREAGLARKAT